MTIKRDKTKSPRSADDLLLEILRGVMANLDTQCANNFDCAYPAFGSGLARQAYDTRRAAFIAFVMHYRQPLFDAFQLWDDEQSADLFFKLLLFRALGHERICLPSNTAEFWKAQQDIECLPSSACRVAGVNHLGLQHFELNVDEHSCALDCLRANVKFAFFLRQYHLSRGALQIRPLAGDYVVDVGGCFGDTAVDFALAIGRSGRVDCFEIVRSHLQVIAHNIAQNPNLCPIIVHPVALSDENRDGDIADSEFDPGFSVNNDQYRVPMRRLDDLVANGEIERVDFLKMDIEGHELAALRGAEQTLRQYRPRLAISLYHRWEDYYQIPLFIDQLRLGYRFYLENYTISDGETIMYCTA